MLGQEDNIYETILSDQYLKWFKANKYSISQRGKYFIRSYEMALQNQANTTKYQNPLHLLTSKCKKRELLAYVNERKIMILSGCWFSLLPLKYFSELAAVINRSITLYI